MSDFSWFGLIQLRLSGKKFGHPARNEKNKLDKVRKNEPKITKMNLGNREIAAVWKLVVWVSRAWWRCKKLEHLCVRLKEMIACIVSSVPTPDMEVPTCTPATARCSPIWILRRGPPIVDPPGVPGCGDGSKPKRGTNSISTGTKIVPVGPWGPRKIFISSKMMNSQPQHIQKRKIVDLQQN